MPEINGNENVMEKEKRGIGDVHVMSVTGEILERAQLRTMKMEA